MTEGILRLRELLGRLVDSEIRFVLVGGLAVNAWGYLRATRDVDIVPDPDPENLERLTAQLQELEGRVQPGRLAERARQGSADQPEPLSAPDRLRAVSHVELSVQRAGVLLHRVGG
jgi:hypothetical protein